MNYNIHITDEADHDMNQAVDYIEFSLQNPVAADALMDAVDLAVSSLAHMPERYRLVDDIVLASWGIRFIRIKITSPFIPYPPKRLWSTSSAFCMQKATGLLFSATAICQRNKSPAGQAFHPPGGRCPRRGRMRGRGG